MDHTPLELRRHADHCRHLAHSHSDERVRVILFDMARELDEQAVELQLPLLHETASPA